MKDVYFDVANKFDNGTQNSVAINADDVVVEVHRSGNNLMYSVGRIDVGYIRWGASSHYDEGIGPSVAMNNGGTVVETHETQSLVSRALFYRVGIVEGNDVSWGDRHDSYDAGQCPSIGVNDNGVVAQIHVSSTLGSYKLFYRVGQVNRDAKTITWGDSHEADDTGLDPAIAINNSGLVVQVHKSEQYDKLYYRVGQVDATARTIAWGPKHDPYEQSGLLPKITLLDDGTIIEVHQGSGDNIFSRLGQVDAANSTIAWNAARESDTISTSTGIGNPAVAANNRLAVETYNTEDNSLWYSSSLILDRARWMGDNLTLWGDKTLKQISFPGSHDAGMYTTNNNCTAGGNDCNTRTQKSNFFDQLQAGIRYFDVRPVLFNGAYYTGHFTDGPVSFAGIPLGFQGCNGGSIADILADVKKFMDTGVKEVVILKFSHYFDRTGAVLGFTPTQKTQLITMVKTALSDYLYINNTRNRLAEIPLNTLIGTKGIVLPVFDDVAAILLQSGTYSYKDFDPASPETSSGLSVYDKFSNTNELTTMIPDQIAKMNNTANHGGDLFLLSWTLTQQGSQPELCLSPVGATSIEDLAIQADTALAQNIVTVQQTLQQRITESNIPNIIYVDLTSGFVTDVCVWLNQRLSLGNTLKGNQNQYLGIGDSLNSVNGNFRLTYQGDGNLVAYSSDGTAVWASGTNGQPTFRCIMQADGNFVVYKAPYQPSTFVTGTNGNPNSKLVLRNGGRLVIQDANDNVLLRITQEPTASSRPGLSPRPDSDKYESS